MASIQDRLTQKQDALNQQFASLETMMANFQSQSNQLSAALAKLNS
jgi:flagellar capping protein FliD